MEQDFREFSTRERYRIKDSNIPAVMYNIHDRYVSQQECLMDRFTPRDFLRSFKETKPRSFSLSQFVFIGKLRNNPNKFVVIRYNEMGLFAELLTDETELDIELKYNDKRIKNTTPKRMQDVVKLVNERIKLLDTNYLTNREFKNIIKALKQSYYSCKNMKTFDNAHIFNLLKNIKDDKNVHSLIWVKEI